MAPDTAGGVQAVEPALGTQGSGSVVPHRDQVAVRIHDGAFSAMDLTARHRRTAIHREVHGQTLAAAGELQRDSNGN
ncbi:hypothetical protein [Streptomyces sp. NPDC058657]|uniref:hypothetical protein n=1 Tax=unclassified Streptomyces TaxID=2593676 RepID=UPI003654D16E